MGVGYLSISAVCTAISFVGLHWWVQQLLDELKSDGLIQPNFTYLDDTVSVLGLLLRPSTSICVLVNCIANAYMLLVLCLKTVFFSKLSSSETRKLLERLINYLIYKGTFLPLVIPPSLFQLGLWSTWLVVLCSLKMFQALARDRLEQLNASPSTTPWTYFRVYSVLLLALTVDIFWIRLCLMICKTSGTSLSLLLLFEPFSIAFETLQAIMVHGFQLLDIWHHHSPGNSCWISKFIDTSAAGSLAEWKSFLLRNFGFLLDMATLSMALGHYMHTCWLRGFAIHFVDVILFLNIRALLSAIFQRVKGFIKLRRALGSLHAVLPDATNEELKAYDDECAICREPMAKAKRLHCKHLFHLGCLRSWLDQGLNNVYACPTCRKPFLAGRPENGEHHRTEVGGDEQLARQLSLGLNAHNAPGQMLHPGLFHSQMQSSLEGGGLEECWAQHKLGEYLAWAGC